MNQPKNKQRNKRLKKYQVNNNVTTQSLTAFLHQLRPHSSVIYDVIPPSSMMSFLHQLQHHSSISNGIIPPSVTTSFLRHLWHHSSISNYVIPPTAMTSFFRQLWPHSLISFNIISQSVTNSSLSITLSYLRQSLCRPYTNFDIALSNATSFFCHV